MPSFTEENYLKAIYKLSEATPGTDVSTNGIAEVLQTRPASVTDMLRRLGEKGLLHYQRYRGVSLTQEGRQLALLTIRKHRLWEVFLVQKLGFNWDEVHDVAEQMEHIDSLLLVRRLDEFLGFPRLDPHGDPIPTEDGAMPRPKSRLVSDLVPGEQGRLMAVKNTSPSFLQYLDKVGLKLGSAIEVLDKITFDNSLEVRVNTDKIIMLSPEVGRNLFVAD
ncbi:metal-dependent transcriptional regulator [Hymenobacter sp. BT186]|uniref:Transcriptional regulator MntR n=1 Tax=Hymenobacter telluris TaxID=2816474 RepID=A0A939JBE8_9BACT|nr:metal-dependent transcriptional regulator [Hymenobacter telluris]MBO0359066.1 metal-dependent transcriptional regulator [Hymenobacter telluris]MBW3375092.1 metal-dependent transcriptional regulator [Hymenobacter norwichensis]